MEESLKKFTFSITDYFAQQRLILNLKYIVKIIIPQYQDDRQIQPNMAHIHRSSSENADRDERRFHRCYSHL